MTSKIIIKLGIKLAIVYTIMVSFFKITTEGLVYISGRISNTSSLNVGLFVKALLLSQLLILVVGLVIYFYIEKDIKKTSKELNILDSILMTQYTPIFRALLGILVMVHGISVLMIEFMNVIYISPKKEMLSSIYFSWNMFYGHSIRLAMAIVEGLVGLYLLLNTENKKQ